MMTEFISPKPESQSGFNRFWRRPATRVFFLALLVGTLMFLPFIILNRGMFTYYGDFNVQQIPFYQHCHDYIAAGNFGWDWYTDLGANFLGSYSFYLLGSPFFWLTLLFPSGAVPYLIAPLLILKFAFIALTGYAYIRRFTRTPQMAMIGALLYAFSGFNVYNIFFNHFHEAVLVFPLLLIALEEELISERKGVFALAVALCATVNYYFFFGQVIFAIVYFIIRCLSKDVRMTVKKFLRLFLEAILGVLLSAVMLLPSVLAIMGNDRISERLWGYDILLYNQVQRYALILQSMFFPPDMPARPNFFTNSNSKWASVSAYLPLFGMVGVITFLRTHNKHWIKRILATSFVLALIPIGNSLFSALNWNYYARWYYMPLLFMALATAITFEEYAEDGNFGRFTTGFVWCGAVTLFCTLIGILPKQEEGETVWFSLAGYPAIFWIYVAIAVIFLVVSYLLLRHFVGKQGGFKVTALVLCASIVSYSWVLMAWGEGNGNGYEYVHDEMLHGAENFSLDDEEEAFYRVNSDGLGDNAAMFWGMPSVQTFHSVVPGSIMSFYNEIGYDRNVASRPDASYLGINGLLSVKYFIVNDNDEAAENVPDGFTYYDTQNGYRIFQNDYYIPMGFTYEGYVDRYTMDGTADKYRDRLMLHAIYLEDEDIEKYGGLLEAYAREDIPNLTSDIYKGDCELRRESACDSFSYNASGFEATITLEKDNLVFFSVPYDEGWSAFVNGEEAEIVCANAGFMAVKADAGANEITFRYHTPGLKTGAVVSAAAAVVLAGWCFLPYIWKKRKRAV